MIKPFSHAEITDRRLRHGTVKDLPAPGWGVEQRNDIVKLSHMTTDSAARKAQPLARGLLDYFPDALADVARLSAIGNEQHNPGEPMHWSRGKSDDHADCIIRHLIDRSTVDADGVLHDTKVAWRALALLQLAIEKARNAGSY